MKKAAVLLLIFAMIWCAALPTFASETPEVTITASSAKVNVGDEVVFTVSLGGCPKVKAMAFVPSFDTEVFDYVLVSSAEDSPADQCGSFLVSGALSDFSAEEKNAVIAFTSETEVNGEVLTFKLKAKKASESFTVKCDVTLTDAENAAVSLGGVSSEVVVVCAHKLGEWKNFDELEHKKVCSVCGHIEAAYHVFGEWERVPSPLAGLNDKEKRTCKDCGAVEERNVFDNGTTSYSSATVQTTTVSPAQTTDTQISTEQTTEAQTTTTQTTTAQTTTAVNTTAQSETTTVKTQTAASTASSTTASTTQSGDDGIGQVSWMVIFAAASAVIAVGVILLAIFKREE